MRTEVYPGSACEGESLVVVIFFLCVCVCVDAIKKIIS